MNKCWECKNINKSIHMKLEDDVLYNVWCKVGEMEDENCSKYEKVEDRLLNEKDTKAINRL